MHGKVFTDPGRQTYRALGMPNSVTATLSVDVFRKAWRAYREGYRQSRTQGDPWQQGGAVVIDRGGVLQYLYVSRTSGDHAPLKDILAVLPRG